MELKCFLVRRFSGCPDFVAVINDDLLHNLWGLVWYNADRKLANHLNILIQSCVQKEKMA